jgi:hypothetical protein
MQVFRENRAVFMLPIFTDSAFYPVALFFCEKVVFLTVFTAVTVIIYIRTTVVLIVNHFLKIIIYTFDFYFLLTDDTLTSENFSMENFCYT